MLYHAEIDDVYYGSYNSRTKKDAIKAATESATKFGRSVEGLVVYGADEPERFTIWSGFAPWHRVFPDLVIGIETNGPRISATCRKWRIFCHRLGIDTIGMDGVDAIS